MLHIFHVDKGRMLSFEMNIALCKVIELKRKIATDLGIIVQKQVLLISGGTALCDNEFVCHYNGGTDSNPIFLFDLLSINTWDETTDLESENNDIKALEAHVKEQVELSVKQPPCANTVSSRAALSQDIYEFSRKQLNSSNTIVLHQHLQQQGWSAVVANLEDILITLSKMTESYNISIEEFLKIREDKIALLGRIEKDVDMLKKIPLLPSLRFSSSQQQCLVNFGSREHLVRRSSGSNTEEDDLEKERNMTSLYDWMCVNNLHDLLDRVNTRLANINEQYYYQHLQEYRSIHSDIKPEFKEIKGLGDRLSQLDNLLRTGTKHVEDQKFVAESFLQNQTRSGLLRDDSIYPNLCESQVQYIRKMLDNFLKVADIHRRCSRAKHELSYNIVSRLIWVTHIEEKVNGFLTKIDLYSGSLKHLMLNIKLLEQIHNAPKLYFKAISEVIRRQKFSKKFLCWTNQLSVESKEIWDKEVHTRKEIASQLSTHFLSTLFPGLNSDFIPAFATEKPKQFDEFLPQLSPQSLNILRESVPELSHILNVEDPVAVPRILEAGLRCNDNTNTLTPSSYGRDIASTDFFSSAVTSSVQGMKASFLRSQETDEGPGSPKTRHHSSRPSSLLRDQPESETDTEEFEKVCGSISDETYSPLLECVPDTKSAKTKHCYPSKASDSKHIKLDSSQHSDETSVRRQPANTTRKIYTESTCTTTTTSSSGVHRQHVPLAHQVSVNSQLSQQAIIAELQKQVDEKSVTILSFQDELENSQSQRETLQTRLNTLASLIHTVLQDLKKEMENLKGKVKEDETTYVKYISDVSTRILEVLEKIQKETEVGHQMVIESALNLAQMEADEKRNTLQAQLNDTSRELEIYQGQTRDYITQIDRLKALMQEGNAQLTAEKEETVKKLTLEHELEMEALKEKWHKEEKERVDEVVSLKESVNKLEEELSKSEDEKQNMSKSVEAKLEQKFQEKEVSIREILWAAYIEHESKSLESQKLELENAFNNERLRVEELHRNELVQKIGELKITFEIESGKRLSEEREEAEKRHLEEIQKCRDLWEAQKEEEVEGKKEELKSQLKVDYDQKLETAKLQYKMDLEGLRSRFRMMTTASMDKSPSETSLEKFERGDFVDSTYHDVVIAKLREELQDEKDKALDELRKNLEDKHTLALRDERETYEGKRKDERRVLETEKQEILKEISQDKERVIEDLRLRVEFLTDETEKMRKINARAQEEARALVLPPNIQEWQEQCELYKKEIDRLNKEVQRAKRLSFVSEKHPDLFPEECPSPSPSVGSDVQVLEGSVQKLQQENRELRNALSSRICSERKRVSLDDAQVHDIVLIVWDDIYQQYRILLETNPILHFLHSDSYAELGLPKGSEKPEKLYCTAQVQKKKEFCQAKRDGNRFRVPRGTKFYRVQAGPIYTHVERPESAFMLHPKAPSGKEPTLEEGAVSDLEETKSSLGSI